MEAERTTPYPIGKPCANHEIEISDEGELLVGGAHVAEGYLNRPELNTARFFMKNDQRWFRTGDKAETDANGLLVYKGRLDRMVKRRGYRIEPAEIEAALMLLKDITVAAIVSHEPQGAVLLTAVLSGLRPIGIIELKQELVKHIPDYMLPDAVVMLDEFPKTSSGKIDYVKLQEIVSSL
jgi:D-alanine--poly(phosphoribitol) ligase subunit 1